MREPKSWQVKNNDPGLVELRAMILKARLLADDHVEQERAGRRYPLCRHPGNASRLLGRPSRDRLGPAREIAQIGAVIGREFSYDLLRTPTAINEIRLTAALDQLVASELVSQRGTPPGASYVFKHALVQEAAHDTLLRTERRRLHSYVANVIEQRMEVVERQPELLAQHYAEAGIAEKAVDYWTRNAGLKHREWPREGSSRR